MNKLEALEDHLEDIGFSVDDETIAIILEFIEFREAESTNSVVSEMLQDFKDRYENFENKVTTIYIKDKNEHT